MRRRIIKKRDENKINKKGEWELIKNHDENKNKWKLRMRIINTMMRIK